MSQHRHPYSSDDNFLDHGAQSHVHDHQMVAKSGSWWNWMLWLKTRLGHQHNALGHSHDTLASYATATERGSWAIKWSFAGLLVTALFQVVIVSVTGSVALLADTIHNFTDAGITIPLWIAFLLARRKPSNRFTYGLGRAEDLAGVAIVLAILFSAIFAGFESVRRLLDPQEINFLWAVVAAALIGFLGNEAVAMFRIKVGKEISSAALVADGYHARVDGLTSLAVFFSAIGVWLGFPLADPIVGLIISVAILRLVWQAGKPIFTRLLDGVEPAMVDEIRQVAGETPGVEEVTEIRVRWLGHRLWVEANVTVAPWIPVEKGHEISQEVCHRLLHQLNCLSNAAIHVDPAGKSGEAHHAHSSGGLS
jgi:cation diffusion facilitator family transporter